MTTLAMGSKAGSGPFLRIMADDAADPVTTPSTAREKFVFDSLNDKLAYMNRVQVVRYDEVAYPMPSGIGSGNGITRFYPAGSDINNFEFAVACVKLRDNNNSRQEFYWPVDPSLGVFGIADAREMNPATGRARISRINYVQYAVNGIQESGVWRSWGHTSMGPFQDLYLSGAGASPRPLYRVSIQRGERETKQWVFYEWKLPFEDVAYPFQPGTPVAGQEVLRIGSDMARLARPGFDVFNANPNNFILHEGQSPSKLIGIGRGLEVDAGQTVSVQTILPPTPLTFVMCQMSTDGTVYASSCPAPTSSGTSDDYELDYKATSTGVDFVNHGDRKFWVNYMIFADDASGPTSGGEKVLETDGGFIRIKRPGSSDTAPSYADVLLDSRLPVPLLIQEGIARWDTHFVSDTSKRHLGSRRFTVNIPEAAGKYQLFVLHTQPQHSILRSYFFSSPYNGWAGRGTNLAVIRPDGVDFWLANDHPRYITIGGGGDFTGTVPDYVRYYIFAIPLSLGASP